MVKIIDKERVLGKIKKEKSIIEFFTGVGTGIIVSCLLSPDSIRRTVVILIGLVMIGIGWYKETRYDNKVFKYMEEFEEDSFQNLCVFTCRKFWFWVMHREANHVTIIVFPGIITLIFCCAALCSRAMYFWCINSRNYCK